jgi:hypothetical protein
VRILTAIPENPTRFIPQMRELPLDTNWILMLFASCIVMCMPGVLLSLLLRFDYQQHLEAHPDADQSEYLKVVAASDTIGDSLTPVGNGVVLPSKLLSFRKIYFNTALVAWIFSQLILLVIFMLFEENRDDLAATINYLFTFVSFGIQAIVLAVGIKALARKEYKKLMDYQESWTSSPLPLPTIEVTTPEGEEEKEKDIMLVEFEV